MAVRIGVISDTHGLMREEVLEVLRTCSWIFHAGDIGDERILDAVSPLGRIYAVRGNCDGRWASRLKNVQECTVEGVRFKIVHNRKGCGSLLGTDVLVFGHTHHYTLEQENDTLFLNPGSCGYSRYGNPVTMAVITAESGKVRVEKIVFEPENKEE